MKKKFVKNRIVIYQTKSGAIEFRGDFVKETIWATQIQISDAFNVDVRTVNEHIKNIYNSDELVQKSTLRNFRIVQKEGHREIVREVQHYNLDVILSVGYRVNSKKATLFRQWATKTLRAHIVYGYTINRSRIAKNYNLFLKAVEHVKQLLPSGSSVDAKSTIELVKLFADTWLSLVAFDKSKLPRNGATRKHVTLTSDDLKKALLELKKALITKNEATDIFGTERQKENVRGIIGNIFQSFNGGDLYPTVEEKAAHLLYFMVKNHPFIDGNKRSGAFAFVWFLQKAGVLNTSRLTPEALTTLTLLVAESNSRDKDRMTGLIIMLLGK